MESDPIYTSVRIPTHVLDVTAISTRTIIDRTRKVFEGVSIILKIYWIDLFEGVSIKLTLRVCQVLQN